MSTEVKEKKTSRLDLRMAGRQKAQIEEAAPISDASVSQRSTGCLLASAGADTESNYVIRLSENAFGEFVRALEGPAAPAFERLLSRRTKWDK